MPRIRAVRAASFSVAALQVVTTVQAAPSAVCRGDDYEAPSGCPIYHTECYGTCYIWSLFQYGTSNGQPSHIPYLAFVLPVVRTLPGRTRSFTSTAVVVCIVN